MNPMGLSEFNHSLGGAGSVFSPNKDPATADIYKNDPFSPCLHLCQRTEHSPALVRWVETSAGVHGTDGPSRPPFGSLYLTVILGCTTVIVPKPEGIKISYLDQAVFFCLCLFAVTPGLSDEYLSPLPFSLMTV